MKKRVTKNLRKSLSVIVSAFVLAIGGACLLAFGGNEVQAEGAIIESSDGRYIAVPVEQVQESNNIPVYSGYLFAGWMKENDNGALKVISSKNNAKYAKFVPEELLTIKAQTTQSAVPNIEGAEDGNKYAGKYVFRFVSSVESLNYYSVGYEVVAKDGTTYTNTADAVCHRIDSTTNGAEYTYSPKVINVESEYFITAKFPVDPGENNKNLNDLYTVRAFWKTLDGTMVYGAPRKLSVSDCLATTTTLNMSFVSESTDNIDEATVLAVTYDEGKSAQASVIGVDDTTKTVHVRVTVDRSTLHSVTEFAFSTSEGTALGNVTYRNLDTKYTGDQTADTTWYDADETEYVIATSADLYGLANIVNGTATDITADAFAAKTIYVVSDIVVNKNLSYEVNTTTGATESVTGNEYDWTQIGTNSAFAGTFEGNMHTISGIYARATEMTFGLFKETAKGSSIQNLKLTNSYFYNTYTGSDAHCTGSIVGRCAGNLVNIYSNAYVASKYFAGGIIGQILTDSNDTLYKQYIQKCWFAGDVYATVNGKSYRHGGIVGDIAGGNIAMENCLNTGTIYCNASTIKGGLCGRVANNTGYTVDLTMKESLNCGMITNPYSGTNAKHTGRVIGSLNVASKTDSNTTVEISSVYATKACLQDSIETTTYPGCGYKHSNVKGTLDITIVTELDLNTWNFDTSIWGIATDGTPMLNMTPVVTE